MVQVANLTRNGFANGDINCNWSRTVLTWADNYKIFSDLRHSFKITFLNKCDELEKPIISEYYQRCFGEDILAKDTKSSE